MCYLFMGFLTLKCHLAFHISDILLSRLVFSIVDIMCLLSLFTMYLYVPMYVSGDIRYEYIYNKFYLLKSNLGSASTAHMFI